jgi:hypothetical protein
MIGSAPATTQQEEADRGVIAPRLVAAVRMDRISHAKRIRQEIASTEQYIKQHDLNVFYRATYDGKVNGLKFALNLLEKTNG